MSDVAYKLGDFFSGPWYIIIVGLLGAVILGLLTAFTSIVTLSAASVGSVIGLCCVAIFGPKMIKYMVSYRIIQNIRWRLEVRYGIR